MSISREDLISHLSGLTVLELSEIVKARPSSLKGTYIKSVSLSSTMSPGVKVALTELSALGK